MEVGWPEQRRRHVFADAGPALQACAATVDEPFVYLKAAVEPAQLRRALPPRWDIEPARYLMWHAGALAAPRALPTGYVAHAGVEHGAHVIRLADSAGFAAASGRLVLHGGTAIFDRIETDALHQRKGLGMALMAMLDALAVHAGASERLLVATKAGRDLYLKLGWQVLAPYATAVLMQS